MTSGSGQYNQVMDLGALLHIRMASGIPIRSIITMNIRQNIQIN